MKKKRKKKLYEREVNLKIKRGNDISGDIGFHKMSKVFTDDDKQQIKRVRNCALKSGLHQ